MSPFTTIINRWLLDSNGKSGSKMNGTQEEEVEGSSIYFGGDAGDFKRETEKISVIYQFLMRLYVACCTDIVCLASKETN